MEHDSERESEERFDLNSNFNFWRVVPFMLLSASVLISVGVLLTTVNTHGKQLDRLELRQDTSATVLERQETSDMQQRERIAALTNRVVELERGREDNRNNISSIVARLSNIEAHLSQVLPQH